MSDDVMAGIGAVQNTGQTDTSSGTMSKYTRSLFREAGWKQDFRDTLAAIQKDGFASYTEKMREEKIKQMRAEILQKMGLSEEKLQAMPADQRRTIDKIVQREIERRLAAEQASDDSTKEKPGKARPGTVATQVQATSQGLANGATMIAVMDQVEQSVDVSGKNLPTSTQKQTGGAAADGFHPVGAAGLASPTTSAAADDGLPDGKGVDPTRRKA